MAPINSVDYSQTMERMSRLAPPETPSQPERNRTQEQELIQLQKIERAEPKTTNQFPLGKIGRAHV